MRVLESYPAKEVGFSFFAAREHDFAISMENCHLQFKIYGIPGVRYLIKDGMVMELFIDKAIKELADGEV